MSSTKRLIERYVDLSARHPFLLLLVYSAITVVSVLALKTLRVNTDFRSLLPKDTPSVRALEESERRRGSTDLYTIAVESPDARANVAFIEALRARIDAEWPEAIWTQIDEDTSFFRDNILLYLPTERLDEFRRELDDALDCELARVNPLFVNLNEEECDEQDVEWTFDYWIGENLARDLGVPEDFFGDLEAELTEGDEPESDGDASEAAESSSTQAEEGGDEEGLPDDLRHYIISPDGTIAVIYVQLNQPSSDVEFANSMQARGMALIDELDPTRFHPEMRAEVVGAYQAMNEAREAVGDSMSALFASIGIVLFMILIFFRAVRGLLVVFLPLCMGVAWTMGLTRVTYAELNLYTLFVGSVLVGMGIDFGIHLYGRAMEAFHGGAEWREALVEALDRTGRAIVASAVTTIGALLTLLFSHFQGFIEFGVIASYGIALCVLLSYLVIPPTVYALERVWPLKRRSKSDKPPRLKPSPRRGWVALALIAIAYVIGASWLAPGAEFEYDFRNYRAKRTSSASSIPYGRALGSGRGSSAAIVLGHSEEQMRQVHEELRKRFDSDDPYLSGFLTVQTYVPPDQDERMAIIQRISRKINRRAMDRLTGETAEFIEKLRERVDVEPFGLEDIPDWALRTLQESDGVFGRIGLLFRRIQEWNVLEVRDYKAHYEVIEVESGPVHVADNTFITSDIITTVQADGGRMGLLASIVLAVVLLVSLRSIRGALICMFAMAAAFALTLGIMVVTNTKVGMFNMIVVPAVLGVSIDGAIHIYHRTREEGIDRLDTVIRTTGAAVAAASLTTAGGFAGLLFQHHRGIASIGQLAVIGILAALFIVFALMPGLLVWITSKKSTETSSTAFSNDSDTSVVD